MTTPAGTSMRRRPTRAGFIGWLVVVALGTTGGTILAHLETQQTDQPTDPPSAMRGLPPVSADLLALLSRRHFRTGPFRPDGPSWVQQSRAVRIDTSREHDAPLSKAAAVTSAAEAVGLSRRSAVAASLVSLTTLDIGLELHKNPNLPSLILPDYLHAASWVVVFCSVQFPVGRDVSAAFASHPDPGGMSPPGGFVVFVDGYDGTLIVGTNVGSGQSSGGRANGVMTPDQDRGSPVWQPHE